MVDRDRSTQNMTTKKTAAIAGKNDEEGNDTKGFFWMWATRTLS